MKKPTLKIFVIAAIATVATLSFATTNAQAYDNALVYNAAHYPVDVQVRYSACRTDSFTVPAATPQGPGRATAGSSRGSCLITTVAAVLKGAAYPVVDYTSSGTSHSRFLVRFMGPAYSKAGYKIYSDWELQNIFDREAANQASPEGSGFNVPAVRNPLNAPLGSPAQVTIAACREANVKLDREIDAIYRDALTKRKITSVESRRYQQLEEGIAARRKVLASDGFTLADCHTMTQLYEAEKAEVIKMAQ